MDLLWLKIHLLSALGEMLMSLLWRVSVLIDSANKVSSKQNQSTGKDEFNIIEIKSIKTSLAKRVHINLRYTWLLIISAGTQKPTCTLEQK